MSQPPQPSEASQPSQPSEPSQPSDPAGPRGSREPGLHQGQEAGGTSGTGRVSLPVIVGCGLLALVLVLSLAAFFGVRTYLDRNESAGTDPASSSTSGQLAAA